MIIAAIYYELCNAKRQCTGWAKKESLQTHGHNSVKSYLIYRIFFTERFLGKFAANAY